MWGTNLNVTLAVLPLPASLTLEKVSSVQSDTESDSSLKWTWHSLWQKWIQIGCLNEELLLGAVEYTDCISPEGVRPPPNECPKMTLNNLMVRFQ